MSARTMRPNGKIQFEAQSQIEMRNSRGSGHKGGVFVTTSLLLEGSI